MSFSKLDLSVLPHARSAAHSKVIIKLKYFRFHSNIITMDRYLYPHIKNDLSEKMVFIGAQGK